MSGHSKWSNIKRKKEATDAVKAKIFTKIGREITVCVKESGADPNINGRLKDLISKAKSNNVPNENIERIIKKASGENDKNNYVSMVYEGYGPNGVAMIVEALTDGKSSGATPSSTPPMARRVAPSGSSPVAASLSHTTPSTSRFPKGTRTSVPGGRGRSQA